jgi:hypothetical protein
MLKIQNLDLMLDSSSSHLNKNTFKTEIADLGASFDN